MSQDPNSDTTTHGIRVRAEAQYLEGESDPDRGRFFFVYRIRIENDSARTVQLLSRRWVILDANNRREEVVGEGVVGKQPILAPGESFEYRSYCPLRTSWGTMEGSYSFADPGGEGFEVTVGRFFLVPAAENSIVSEG